MLVSLEGARLEDEVESIVEVNFDPARKEAGEYERCEKARKLNSGVFTVLLKLRDQELVRRRLAGSEGGLCRDARNRS